MIANSDELDFEGLSGARARDTIKSTQHIKRFGSRRSGLVRLRHIEAPEFSMNTDWRMPK
jgi:hypothetical protein